MIALPKELINLIIEEMEPIKKFSITKHYYNKYRKHFIGCEVCGRFIDYFIFDPHKKIQPNFVTYVGSEHRFVCSSCQTPYESSSEDPIETYYRELYENSYSSEEFSDDSYNDSSDAIISNDEPFEFINESFEFINESDSSDL